MKPETLILGGMLTSICMWSGHTSPSMISTPFHWHNWRNISRISMRFSSKNTFRLYFGANTIWYLQFHFVCAKLLVSMRSFFIDKSSNCVWFDWQVVPILSQLEDFFHRLTFFEPRDYRVVFGYKKSPCKNCRVIWLSITDFFDIGTNQTEFFDHAFVSAFDKFNVLNDALSLRRTRSDNERGTCSEVTGM